MSTVPESLERGRRALTGAEGEELVASALRGRLADRELAAALDRPGPAGTGVTAQYLEELGRRPALPSSSERELIAAAQMGSATARARLVEAFLPLIASVARLYRESPRIDRIELIQEGVVGLLRALERYEPERGVPFWAYAVWWVRQAMQQLVAELTRPTIMSDRALRQLARVRDAQRSAVSAGGREPTPAELAAQTGLAVEHVESLLAADRPARSLEQPVPTGEDEASTLAELIPDPLAEGEYERVLAAIGAAELVALLGTLSEREREILRARYGVDGEEQTLRQIAERLGVSAERVRQLEQRALAKLAAVAAGGGGGAAR